MELTLEYKQSEIGPLPPDWTVVPLGAVVQCTEYGSSAPSKPSGIVPVLRMGNLQGGKIDWRDLVFTDDPAEIKRYKLHEGDVLFNRTNTVDLVGKTSIYEGGQNAVFAGYLIRIVTRSAKLDARYLNFVMNTAMARKHSAKVLSQAVGQANINAQKLKTYPIPLPRDVYEQRAIATALGDVDALLDGLGRLIAKKRDLKQAAMQQLLTGQTRLPGFSGKWEVKRLEDVVDTDPESIGAGTPANFAFKYIALEDVNRGVLKSYSEQVLAMAPSRARRKLKCDDILVSTVRPNLQSHLLFAETDGNWICSTGFCVVRCRLDLSHAAFVFNQLFTGHVSQQIDTLLTGSNYPAINSSDVQNLTIPIPAVAEQSAIAGALSDMDAEIAAVEFRRNKTHDLKQAMMQELLTGRTRLI